MPCKQEGRSSDAQHLCKKPGVLARVCNPSIRQAQTARLLKLTVLYIFLPMQKLKIKRNPGGPGWVSMQDVGVGARRKINPGGMLEERTVLTKWVLGGRSGPEKGGPKADRLQSRWDIGNSPISLTILTTLFSVAETPTRQNQLQSDFLQPSMSQPHLPPNGMRLGPVLAYPTWQLCNSIFLLFQFP